VPLTFVTVRDRPDLVDEMWRLPNPWPRFMQQDVVSDFVYDLMPIRFPEYQLLALDGDRVVARVNAVPYAWSGKDEDLHESGWESALGLAFRPEMPEVASAVSLIEARMHPDAAGRGFSAELLLAARENARSLGYEHLLAPIRPTRKQLEPHTPIEDYVARTRDDGAPFDPWIRAHVRLGGRLVKICHCAMTIAGSLAEWREWTALPFDDSGLVVVDGALNPVHVSVENDYAVYVEPNIWIDHLTTKSAPVP
jgi:GNAT superfamily N-acetyltransferase